MLLKTVGAMKNLHRRFVPKLLSRREAGPAICAAAASDYSPNTYDEDILWEVPVQLCLRNLLCAGDCALDVGANIGAIAIAMSRLVGSAGVVHAFEANPRTLPRLHSDLSANDVRNVTVVPKAVWSSSGESIAFYCDNGYYAAASSVYRRDPTWQEVQVPTISLDDYCSENDLSPTAVKLDVEGAEFHVIQGAKTIINRCAPSFVLEYYPAANPDDDPVETLKSRGYAIYDTNLYQPVDRAFYLTNFTKVPMANVLAISPTSSALASYAGLSRIEIPHDACKRGAIKTGELPLLEPGRYVIAAEIEGPPQAVAILRVVDANGQNVVYGAAQLEQLKQHPCSHMVIETKRPLIVYCEISSCESTDVAFRDVTLTRIELAPGRGSVPSQNRDCRAGNSPLAGS